MLRPNVYIAKKIKADQKIIDFIDNTRGISPNTGVPVTKEPILQKAAMLMEEDDS